MMFDRNKFWTLVGAIGLVLSIGACQSKKSDGGSKAESEEPKQEKQKQQKDKGKEKQDEGSAKKGDSASKKTVTIEPVGNKMKYAKTEFTVKPGQKVHLVFNNTATSKAMKHNVCVLNTNDEKTVSDFAQKSLKAGKDKGYVDESHDALIAHTPLSNPGEKVEVTFTAPEKPGKYKYVCTYPAHYNAGMVGVMKVQK
jgi:azurin